MMNIIKPGLLEVVVVATSTTHNHEEEGREIRRMSLQLQIQGKVKLDTLCDRQENQKNEYFALSAGDVHKSLWVEIAGVCTAFWLQGSFASKRNPS